MISNFFGNTKPISFLVLVVFNSFFAVIYNFIGSENFQMALLKVFGAVFLVFVHHYVIVNIAEKNNFAEKTRYLLLFSSILMSFLPKIYVELDFFLSFVLILIGILKISFFRDKIPSKKDIFDASLLFILASFLYNWAIFGLLFCWFVIFGYFSQKFRASLVPIVAFLMIFILGTAVYLGISPYFDVKIQEIFKFSVGFSAEFFSQKEFKMALFLMLFLTLMICVIMLKAEKKSSISVLSLFYFAFLVNLFLFFIEKDKNISILMLFSLPLSIFGTISLQMIENQKIKEISLISLLVFAILAQFTNLFVYLPLKF